MAEEIANEPTDQKQFYQDAGGQAGGGNPLQTQPLSYFQLTQPIFAGFRDFAAVSATKSLIRQSRWMRDQASLDLLADIAQVFYTVVSLDQDMGVLRETKKLTLDRIHDLHHWVSVGRSRPGEMLSAQAQLAAVDGQIQATRRAYASARETLLFLTGISTDVPLRDERLDPIVPPLTETLTRMDNRPDLRAAEETIQQALYGVRYARGGHMPTLGFNGKYYTERVGFLTDVRWDATFLLDVPLFEGGTTSAQVKEARSQEIQARLMLARAHRLAQQQVRTARNDLGYLVEEVKTYEKAVDLAERNYREEEKDYRHGLVSNLDVLKTLSDLQDLRQKWMNARASAKRGEVLLHVSLGEGL